MGAKCILKILTVGCWNIQGLYERVNGIKICKLDDVDFQNWVKKFDILCLQETHISYEENIPILKGFCPIPHCRKKK